MGDGLSYGAVGKVIPELVQLVLKDGIDRKSVWDLIEAFLNLPHNDHSCIGAHALYLELSKASEEETFGAFLLWVYARQIVNSKDFDKIDQVNKVKCEYVANVLESSTQKYSARYNRLVELEEWSTLEDWHTKYATILRWYLPYAVKALYKVKMT
jgi:hypothetical protein